MTIKEKRALEIKLFGNSIKIVTDEDEEYVFRVVSFLNKKMDELSKSVKIASSTERITLVALSVADEYFKQKENGGQLTGLNIASLIDKIDDALH